MQLRVEKVSLMGTVIVPIFFMYYSIIKRRYMRNERYDNDSKFNKNLWKMQILPERYAYSEISGTSILI